MSEILDIVDEDGNPTGQTVDRSLAHTEGIRHRTSHVWLIRRRCDRWQLLLQKRSDEKDSFPGCWDISSAGHIPAGSGFEESAVRELHEELGVLIDKERLVPCGLRHVEFRRTFYGKPFHDNQVSRVFLLQLDLEEDDFLLQKEEISEVRWMDFRDVYEGVRDGSFPNCIDLEELDMIRAKLESLL